MVWIQLDANNTVEGTESEPLYVVKMTVTLAYGIDKELFVHRTDDGTFQYVATSADIVGFGVSRDTVSADRDDFYRSATMTKAYTSEPQAVRAFAAIQARLRSVVRALNAISESERFGGNQTIQIDSED